MRSDLTAIFASRVHALLNKYLVKYSHYDGGRLLLVFATIDSISVLLAATSLLAVCLAIALNPSPPLLLLESLTALSVTFIES
mmetsp:Transcript_510/g.748  ORF Transcript_510/g.748 Transcript_510/m.748 type:complete len:83 (+) Transcript_510:200-448(+)